MGSWGSTSGWNHAIGYYLRIALASAVIFLLLYLLIEAEQWVLGGLFGLLAFFGWPLILTVLLFNEIDRQVSKRLVQYHQSLFGQLPQQSLGSVSGWNHAIAYYIRVIGAMILLTVILIALAVAEELTLFAVFFVLSTLLWPVILLVLLFNESDRLMTRRLKAYDKQLQPHPYQPASWGSVSGWNHAIAYYIRVFLTALLLCFVIVLLFAAGLFAEGLALLFIILLLWGVIVWVLLFNENDRLISKRLSAYHEQATPDQPVQQHSPAGPEQSQSGSPPRQNTQSSHQPQAAQQPVGQATPSQQQPTATGHTQPTQSQKNPPQQRNSRQRQQQTHIRAFDELPFRTIVKYVLGMFSWNYLLGVFYGQWLFSDEDEFDLFLTGDPDSFTEVMVNMMNSIGVFSYSAHVVDISNGLTGNLYLDDEFRFLFLDGAAIELPVPSVLIVLIPGFVIAAFAFWLAYKSDFATPLDGAKVGAASVIVYFPLFLLGALLIEANGASPVLWMSVLAGIAYPVVFGGIGGYLGISLRDSGDEPTGRRKRPQGRRSARQNAGENGRRPR